MIGNGYQFYQLWNSDIFAILSRQLASYLDQVALYGGGPPAGLINVPNVPQNVAIDPANLHPSFCAVEEQVESADVVHRNEIESS